MGSSLGRVLDPRALDACAGARARLRVDVPASWLTEGAILRITAPSRLACARCDGGGCDGCDRSGALHSPADPADRVVTATLTAVGGEALVLRVPRPFGADHAIRQLLVELRAAEASSPFVTRVAPPSPPPEPIIHAASRFSWGLVALAAAAVILAALLGR